MKAFVCNENIDVTEQVLDSALACPDTALFIRKLVDEAGVRFVKPVKVYAECKPDASRVSVTLE